ncbi:hypothetical protein [Nocardia sp. NBC_00511]|uniref:hypothetical protein n=1 Tax=Nocardia sp. NBC_00511 TaxID=2903591 RepID=UPI0030E016EA
MPVVSPVVRVSGDISLVDCPPRSVRLPLPAADVLTAAARGRRPAIAELLRFTRVFVTGYCRAGLGTIRLSDELAVQVCEAVVGGWPAAHAAGRDFLEFAYSTARRAVRVCRYEVPSCSPLTPLTDLQREIVTLRVVLGLSVSETAAALRIPMLEVHRDSGRALKTLSARPHRRIA